MTRIADDWEEPSDRLRRSSHLYLPDGSLLDLPHAAPADLLTAVCIEVYHAWLDERFPDRG